MEFHNFLNSTENIISSVQPLVLPSSPLENIHISLNSFEADQIQPGLQPISERGGLPIRKFTAPTRRHADRPPWHFSASYRKWELEEAGQESYPKNTAQHFEGARGLSWHSLITGIIPAGSS